MGHGHSKRRTVLFSSSRIGNPYPQVPFIVLAQNQAIKPFTIIIGHDLVAVWIALRALAHA